MVQMFTEMPRIVKEGSVWYLLSISWIKVWQEWAYIGLITNGDTENLDNQMSKPGKIDNSEITIQNNKSLLTVKVKGFEGQNVQLKSGLREGEDFLLVTPEIFEFAQEKYGLIG